MTDVIIDFETLGKGSERDDFIILDVACLKFDLYKQDNFEDLVDRAEIMKFNLDEQLKIGWKAEKDTLEWWKSQGEAGKKALKPTPDDVTLSFWVDSFIEFLTPKPKRMWARGTDFDFPIAKRIFRQVGKDCNKYWRYNSVNDTRTYINAITDFKIRNDFIPPAGENVKFEKHVASHDVAMDVLRLQYLNAG